MNKLRILTLAGLLAAGAAFGTAGSVSAAAAGSSDIEKVVSTGYAYLGTPYEYGSDRGSDDTFDCSDFVRWIFLQAAGVTLPADSRGQGAYVRENAGATTDWRALQRGDLMFFMSYRGQDAANYARVDRKTTRITHVGVYLGDGRMLHTASAASGGVRVDDVAGTAWEHRFLFGGSALD